LRNNSHRLCTMKWGLYGSWNVNLSNMLPCGVFLSFFSGSCFFFHLFFLEMLELESFHYTSKGSSFLAHCRIWVMCFVCLWRGHICLSLYILSSSAGWSFLCSVPQIIHTLTRSAGWSFCVLHFGMLRCCSSFHNVLLYATRLTSYFFIYLNTPRQSQQPASSWNDSNYSKTTISKSGCTTTLVYSSTMFRFLIDTSFILYTFFHPGSHSNVSPWSPVIYCSKQYLLSSKEVVYLGIMLS